MSDTRTATLRTTINSVVLGLVIYVAGLLGWDVNFSDPVVIAAIGLGSGIVYRLSVLITDKLPVVSWVLFGTAETKPEYLHPAVGEA